MVRILVGRPPTEYQVHKALLMSRCEYFRKALAADHFVEGRTNFVIMEEDDPQAFDIFVNWLYTRSLPDAVRTDPHDQPSATLALLKFFIFADKIVLGNSLKKDIMDRFYITFFGVFPEDALPGLVCTALRGTADDCPMRRLALDVASLHIVKKHAGFNTRLFTETLSGCDLDETTEFVGNCFLVKRLENLGITLVKSFAQDKTITNFPRYKIGFLRDE